MNTAVEQLERDAHFYYRAWRSFEESLDGMLELGEANVVDLSSALA